MATNAAGGAEVAPLRAPTRQGASADPGDAGMRCAVWPLDPLRIQWHRTTLLVFTLEPERRQRMYMALVTPLYRWHGSALARAHVLYRPGVGDAAGTLSATAGAVLLPSSGL